jgi:predicted nucleic-acid-binding protein
MKGLDTNVLVRYLVRDDPAQERAALAFVLACGEAGEPIFVNAIVLCELVWVLRSSYDYSKPDVAAVVEKILSAEQFEVEDVDAAWLALQDYKLGRADYADCLIGRRNAGQGCQTTVSFDGRLKDVAGFELLPHATRPAP